LGDSNTRPKRLSIRATKTSAPISSQLQAEKLLRADSEFTIPKLLRAYFSSEVLKRKPLAIRDFRSAEPPEAIPLDEVVGRFAGHFTCMFETLIWSPPAGADFARDHIELLGKDGRLLATDLRRLRDSGDGAVRFQLDGSERPAFARIRRRDGSLSALAIVVLLDELRDAVREARNRRIETLKAPSPKTSRRRLRRFNPRSAAGGR
jgi:hypothetical protein